MIRSAAMLLMLCGCSRVQPTLTPVIATTLSSTLATTPAAKPSPEVTDEWDTGEEDDAVSTSHTEEVLEWAFQHHNLLIGCTTFAVGVLIGRRKRVA